jgi:hypothetical protein
MDATLNTHVMLSDETSRVVGDLPPEHPPVKIQKVGVLLVNLGTPDGTDYRSMRRYLKEFLTDKRVIEWPRALWYPILFGIVLNTRPKRVGKAYEEIWNNDLDESYLRTYTRNQSDMLGQALCGPPCDHGGMGDALRAAVDPGQAAGAQGCRMRPHRSVSAVSAIRRSHHRHRQRQGLPGHDGHALAAGFAHRSTLP